jgi:hypothetical protein
MARSGGSWKKGQSGNPNGRPVGTPHDHPWFAHLQVAAKRKLEVDEDGKPVPVKYEKGKMLDWMTVAADKVWELAGGGNAWAIEHVANRFDGKVREQVDVTHNTNVKIRYESYEEARAALLEEGVDINRIPMLTDMRPPEERETN